MIALVFAATADVVTAKVAFVAPAAIVTLAGTLAAALLLESAIDAPPLGAAALSVTVPVEPLPPTRLDGLIVSVDSDSTTGFTVSVAVRVTPPETAVIVADVDAVTDVVVIVNFALVAPEGTFTLAGTLTALELSERDTAVPPLGAGALKVTVPVAELPPDTLVGLTVIAEIDAVGAARFTESPVLRITPSSDALSSAVVLSVGNVVTTKVAEVAPPGTVTLLGTRVTSGREVSILIATPTAGAGPASVTVPVDDAPPTTLAGFSVREVSAGRLGYSVKGCDNVTPPPVTRMVTTTGAVTGAVVMLNRPRPLTAVTVTVAGTAASEGSLLVTFSSWSCPTPSAVVTTP
jgi:hypothetical protein